MAKSKTKSPGKKSAPAHNASRGGSGTASATKPAMKAAGKESIKVGSAKGGKPVLFSKKAQAMGDARLKKEKRPEPEPIQPPVPTDARPRKNQAGLAPKELEHFRDLLLAKRRELVGDMSSMEREALRSTSGSNLSNLPIHMADMGTDNYEQEFTLGLVEKDHVLLREINTALAKIQDGSYGTCEGTGKPIGKARLEAKPWAKHSIEYTRKMESRMVR